MTDESIDLASALAPKLALLAGLADTRNLTRAAELAGVPQPTASRWLSQLGARLDGPVAIRVGRGWS